VIIVMKGLLEASWTVVLHTKSRWCGVQIALLAGLFLRCANAVHGEPAVYISAVCVCCVCQGLCH